MAKKATAKKSKAPRKAARAAKKPNDVRFIMVVEPTFKTKMKAAAKKNGISMSGWVRNVLEKALR